MPWPSLSRLVLTTPADGNSFQRSPVSRALTKQRDGVSYNKQLAKLLSREWGAFAKPFGPSQSHQQQLRHQSNDQPNVLLGLNAQRPPQDRYRNSHPNLHVPLSRITKFDRAVDQSSDDSEQQHLAGNATEWSIVSLSQSATPQNWTGSLRHAHFHFDSHSRRIPNTPQNRAERPPAKEDK